MSFKLPQEVKQLMGRSLYHGYCDEEDKEFHLSDAAHYLAKTQRDKG